AGAISGADVSRSERSSDLERATQGLGFEGRVNHARGDDRWSGVVMYQGRRAPFGFTTAETRATGLLLGADWSRPNPNAGRVQSTGVRNETRLKATYLRGT